MSNVTSANDRFKFIEELFAKAWGQFDQHYLAIIDDEVVYSYDIKMGLVGAMGGIYDLLKSLELRGSEMELAVMKMKINDCVQHIVDTTLKRT